MKIFKIFFIFPLSLQGIPSTPVSFNDIPVSFQNTADAAIDVASVIAAGYWINHSLDEFAENELLAEQIPSLKANTVKNYLTKQVITAGLITTATLGIKTFLWGRQKQRLLGPLLFGNTASINNAMWQDKAFDLGGAVGMGLLAYGCLSSTLIPDAYVLLKKKVQKNGTNS